MKADQIYITRNKDITSAKFVKSVSARARGISQKATVVGTAHCPLSLPALPNTNHDTIQW